MSTVTDFDQLVTESANSRLRGVWLVSMLFGQRQALSLVAQKLDRPGLEHMNRAIVQASRLHESVAEEIPMIRRDKIVGTTNAKLLVGWALTLGLHRTNPDIDGALSTSLRSIAVSKSLIRLIQLQQKFGPDMDSGIDQAAALNSALDRAESEVRQFVDSVSEPQGE